MIRKTLIAAGTAVLAATALGVGTTSAHTLDAYCSGPFAVLSGSLYQEADYSIDGGPLVHFVGGFSVQRKGTVTHTVTVSNSSDNTGNGTKSTPVCVDEETTVPETTTPETTTPETTIPETTVPETTEPETSVVFIPVCIDGKPNPANPPGSIVVCGPTDGVVTPTTERHCAGVDERAGFPSTGHGTWSDDQSPCYVPGFEAPVVPEPPVEATATTVAASLPVTGADTGDELAIVAGLIGLGSTLAIVARRRRAA